MLGKLGRKVSNTRSWLHRRPLPVYDAALLNGFIAIAPRFLAAEWPQIRLLRAT
jgi:hypothetical protein